MSKEYYIRVKGKILGPFPVQELLSLVASGKLKPNHELSSDRRDWRPARKHKLITFPPNSGGRKREKNDDGVISPFSFWAAVIGASTVVGLIVLVAIFWDGSSTPPSSNTNLPNGPATVSTHSTPQNITTADGGDPFLIQAEQNFENNNSLRQAVAEWRTNNQQLPAEPVV